MPLLPYRTVLRLPAGIDVRRLAEQEVQSWIESGKKVDKRNRAGFLTGEFFEPGLHELRRGCTFSVAEATRGAAGGSAVLLRLVEQTKVGTWQVDVGVLDSAGAGSNPDTLLIRASRIDQPEADSVSDPPALVRQMLAREEIFDGVTPVTAEPMLVRPESVADVVEAVRDAQRSVTVIVASSFEEQYNEPLRKRVAQLTSKLTGVAAVFVLTRRATDAFNEAVPASHALEYGRVRTYLPQVDFSSVADGRRHRVLGPQAFAHAIQGDKVAEHLQRAFAFQTRHALLASPLPRALRRQLAPLEEAVASFAREAAVEQRVRDVRNEANAARRGRPRTKLVESDSSRRAAEALLDQIRSWFARWTGRPVEELDANLLGDLDEQFSRRWAEADELRSEVQKLENRLASAQDAYEELAEAHGLRGLELVDAEERADSAEARERYLRRQLVEAGRAAEAHGYVVDADWAVPDNLSELALLLSPGLSEHKAAKYVQFTGDLDCVMETDQRDQDGLWVQRCWKFVHALHDYAELKTTGRFSGNVHAYLGSGEHDGFKVSGSRHAPTETKQTIEQWGKERVFPVPTDVSQSGRIAMYAHFKAGQENTYAPRLHYYDDTTNTGKIYIGYIGRHLTNTKTRNT